MHAGMDASTRDGVSTEAFPAFRGNPRFEALVVEAKQEQPGRP